MHRNPIALRAARCTALVSLLCGALVAQNSHPGLVYATVQTGGGPLDLRLDLQVPAGSGPFPVLVWIHGGGWQGGSRLPIPASVTRHLVRGYAVASIDYRLSGTAIWPAQIHDCKAAIRFLRANAALYALDADRIAVMGSSAGGHLVAALGTMGDVGEVRSGSFAVDLEGSVGPHVGTSSRVNAVVDLFGPANMLHAHDMPTFDHDGVNSPESRLIGGALQQHPERWATVDPIPFLSPDDPPLIALHGTDDTTVPFHQSELLLDAARTIGHSADLLPIQDNGHGGPGFSSPQANAAVDAFLDRHLRDLPAVRVAIAAIDPQASEGGDPASFRISRTGSLVAELRVGLWLAGAVTPGVDCAALPLIAAIPAGQASVDLQLRPLDDGWVEGDERATLHVGASASYRIDHAASSASAVLSDDESSGGLPVVSLAPLDPTAAEAGLDPGAIRCARTGSTAAALEVRYEISGTAYVGADCQPLAGRVTIPAGSATAQVVIVPRPDLLPEAGETVVLRIAEAAHYARSTVDRAHVVIADDDRIAARPIVGVLGTELALSEPADGGAFTLTRTGPTLQPLTVRFAISGRALGGADYASPGSSAVIPAGAAWVRVPVAVLDDAAVEGEEDLVLRVLPDPTYQVGAAAQRALSILDDEAPPYAPASLQLAVSPIALREPAHFSLVGGAPSGFASVWLGVAPSYVPLAPYGVMLFDPLAAFPFASSGLDTAGALHFSFVVPEAAELIGVALWFQAFGTIAQAPLAELSGVAVREVGAARAL